jgi:hypothetical protein
MPNYDLTRHTTSRHNSVDEALAALETQLETVDDTKTIRLVNIQLTGRDKEQAIGFTLYDT